MCIRDRWTAFLLAGGFATGVVMVFSPTIYASTDRPYLYLYFVLIYGCADAVWNMGGMKAVWKTGSSDAVRKMPVPEKLMFTVLGLLVLANKMCIRDRACRAPLRTDRGKKLPLYRRTRGSGNRKRNVRRHL